MLQTGTGFSSVLLVDKDAAFCKMLVRDLARHGLMVSMAHDMGQALSLVKATVFKYAVVEQGMGNPSGLALVYALSRLDADIRIVVLADNPSIASAVDAIKLGAIQYLCKPASAAKLMEEFGIPLPVATSSRKAVATLDQHEYEQLQRALLKHDSNISLTARALNMHRRTLQRKLSRLRPK